VRRAQLPADGVVDARILLLALTQDSQRPLVAKDRFAVQFDFLVAEFRRGVTFGVTVVAASETKGLHAVQSTEVGKQQSLVDRVAQRGEVFYAFLLSTLL
jgi:hypothetical protein